MISEIKEIMKKHVKVAAWVSNELLKRAQSTFASVSSTFPLYMITKSYLFNQPCRIFNIGVDFFIIWEFVKIKRLFLIIVEGMQNKLLIILFTYIIKF